MCVRKSKSSGAVSCNGRFRESLEELSALRHKLRTLHKDDSDREAR